MPYTGQNMDKRYPGENADIRYSIKRCIHAEECILRLVSVFNKDARPWIDANGASTQEIMNVVARCPSGALHVQPKDGTLPETPAERNVVVLWRNGPLQFRGHRVIRGAGVDIADETRATLCRCGRIPQ